MKCAICGHGDVIDGAATATFDRGTTTVVIKAVPAGACNQCGETYFDEATTRQLMQIAEVAGKSGVEVEVRQFAAA
jgi:YgiT-type zinc finger domain-containing protein